MKKKLLILTAQQFGYLTDTFKYCQHASEQFDITYVCWNYNRPEMHFPRVKVKYVSRRGNLAIRNFRLLKAFNQELKKDYDAVFACYTRGISLVKLLNPTKKIIFDIRTLSVSPSVSRRLAYDFLLKLESSVFDKVTVISEGLAESLRLKNYLLLPLGADRIFDNQPAKTDSLHLLYVGTLQNRNIIKCVEGFHSYCRTSGDEAARFTIVGDSSGGELAEIKKYVLDSGLTNQVFLAGRVPHDRLSTYFEQANVGVAFIPITDYYDFQPPTKTFEYLLSGIPVIATKTQANKEILKNFQNSVLINDDKDEFADAVLHFRDNLSNVNSTLIQTSAEAFSWKLIINDRFIPIIKQISG